MIHNGDLHGEAMLFFGDGNQSGTDDAGLYPASTFLGMEIASSSTVKLTFMAAVGTAAIDTVVVTFSGNFKDACRGIAGALNSNTMTVVADEANSTYMAYNGGAFSGTVTVAQA